jgi:hypothetical protein
MSKTSWEESSEKAAEHLVKERGSVIIQRYHSLSSRQLNGVVQACNTAVSSGGTEVQRVGCSCTRREHSKFSSLALIFWLSLFILVNWLAFCFVSVLVFPVSHVQSAENQGAWLLFVWWHHVGMGGWRCWILADGCSKLWSSSTLKAWCYLSSSFMILTQGLFKRHFRSKP